ncbi:hypothetical protein GQX73_g5381 [Xylaria multiplex]|uniref:Rhodopsin domain-containing protein n=1 Tax=Xylaria multiplex TaxID=323545 RepID=A0A7C8J0S4_9PEZI|nr:hypothetical protein GQX73_g5381 [Xylaria multiplex]
MDFIDLSKFPPAEQEKILNRPALTPPPGVVPNFDNPPNQNDAGIATNAICLFITLVVVVLRAYAKIVCVKKLHIEDYLVAPALTTYVAYVYCDFWMLRDGGLFVHQWDVRLKDISHTIFILHVGVNLCAGTIMFLKVSILLEWIRIFVPFGTRNRFYWTSMVVLVLHTVFFASWIIAENLSYVKKIHILAASINLIANFVIIALPQWTIWTLQMHIKKKIGVILIFAIGILSLAAGATRLYLSVALYRSDDILYDQSGVYLSALIEMTCLFLVFCVPSIPKVFAETGLVAKVKSMLPGQWQGPPSSADSVGAFTTMVTARGCDSSQGCQETPGILRTTEFTFTAEKAASDQQIAHTEDTKGKMV